jgi:protein-arginine kinase activator protein McsA
MMEETSGKKKKAQGEAVEDVRTGSEDLKAMSIEELNSLLNEVLESEDYIRAIAIRDEMINSRKKKPLITLINDFL